MGILNLLNPIRTFYSIKILLKDLSNYRFYRKQIKKMKDQKLFDVVEGRVDWLSRVYYVLNLQPETLLATGDLIDLEKSRVYDSISKLQGRFADNNLVEIVEVNSKRIKDSEVYAYLVTIGYNVQSKVRDLTQILIFCAFWYILVSYAISISENYQEVLSLITNVLTAK